MSTLAIRTERRETSKTRAKNRSKNRSKTWASINLQYTHSHGFDDDCDDEYNIIYNEWNDCLNKVLENRIKENYTCLCCGSLVCDYFDEIESADNMLKKIHEARRQSKPVTFSCYGPEL